MTRRWWGILMACLGAVAILAGCPGGGPPTPQAPDTKKAPAATLPGPPAATKAPAGGAAQAPPAASAAGPPAAAPQPPGYDARGRRDPFRPLVVVRAPSRRPTTGLASLDPVEIKLTGVVWDQRGYYGLVEAPNGLGYVIRVNDVIGDDARVTRITPEGMTLEIQTRAELPRQQAAKRVLEIRLRKEEER